MPCFSNNFYCATPPPPSKKRVSLLTCSQPIKADMDTTATILICINNHSENTYDYCIGNYCRSIFTSLNLFFASYWPMVS